MKPGLYHIPGMLLRCLAIFVLDAIWWHFIAGERLKNFDVSYSMMVDSTLSADAIIRTVEFLLQYRLGITRNKVVTCQGSESVDPAGVVCFVANRSRNRSIADPPHPPPPLALFLTLHYSCTRGNKSMEESELHFSV